MRLKSTKNGGMMAYVQIEDESGGLEVVVFPRTLQQYSALLKEDTAILLDGSIDAREDEAPKIIAGGVNPLTEESLQIAPDGRRGSTVSSKQAAKAAPGKLHIKIGSMEGGDFERVKQVLLENRGEIPVQFYPQDSGKRLLAPRGLWIARNMDAVEKIRCILGAENVIMK